MECTSKCSALERNFYSNFNLLVYVKHSFQARDFTFNHWSKTWITKNKKNPERRFTTAHCNGMFEIFVPHCNLSMLVFFYNHSGYESSVFVCVYGLRWWRVLSDDYALCMAEITSELRWNWIITQLSYEKHSTVILPSDTWNELILLWTSFSYGLFLSVNNCDSSCPTLQPILFQGLTRTICVISALLYVA